jgi:hypothetical protein
LALTNGLKDAPRKFVLKIRLSICGRNIALPLNIFKKLYFSPEVAHPERLYGVKISVPDPDPPDPHVFVPPGSGSGSFCHHAKIVRKTLIPAIL